MRRRAPALRWLVGAALVLTACAAAVPPEDKPYTSAYADEVFGTAYSYVAERYIEPVEMRDFAIAGIGSLELLEPRLDVSTRDGAVDVAVGTDAAASLALPASNDPDRWAGVTVAAIDAARAASPLLAGTPAEELFETVFKGALSGLDSFSRYASAARARNNRAFRVGFGGIGVAIRMEEAFARIVSVLDGGPSQRAGLRADDRVVRIDGAPVAGWPQQQLIDTLRGRVGDAVRLSIERDGAAAPLEISLVREKIVPETVKVSRRGDAAILTVSSFNKHTASKIAAAVRAARRGPDAATGIVLDLRGNPGGLLDQAVQVADVFLPGGEIVATRGRHPRSRQRFTASAGDAAAGLPLVVLVNGGSASASEVVAAALQDHGRAIVVGTNSYGKGTVQTVFRLPNDGELTLTWSHLHAPTGYRLHGLGVLPTLCTHGGGALPTSAALLARLRAGENASGDRLRAWRAMNTADSARLAGLRAVCPSDNGAPPTDFEVAVSLIDDPNLYARALALSQVATAR